MNTKEKDTPKYKMFQVSLERHKLVMVRLKELGYSITKERGYALFCVSSVHVVQELRKAVEELRHDKPLAPLLEILSGEAETILRLSLTPFDEGYAVYITDEALTDVYRFSRDIGRLSN